MKRFLFYLFRLNVLMTFISCSTDIKPNEIVNKNSPFILTETIQENNGLSKSEIDTINVGTKKWERIFEFVKTNRENWKSTPPASYFPDFYIRQDSFRILGWKNANSVIISYESKKGESKQLTRSIKEGSLNFLFE